jgi:hypothetical protein
LKDYTRELLQMLAFSEALCYLRYSQMKEFRVIKDIGKRNAVIILAFIGSCTVHVTYQDKVIMKNIAKLDITLSIPFNLTCHVI